MDIFIFSHDEALEFLQGNPKEYDIVIISNNSNDYPDRLHSLANESYKLTFDDISKPCDDYQEPREEDIRGVLKWAKGRQKLVCACHAGISRSSATAFLCKLQECGSAEEAAKVWNPERHWPNKLIVELGARILKNKAAVEEHVLFMATTNRRRWYQ